MSLSSFLLPGDKGKAKEIDKGLDDLFRSSATVAPPRPPVATPAAPTATSDKKRKATEETPNGKSKRSKADAADSSPKKAPVKPAKQKAKKTAESSSESEEDEDAKLAERMHKKSKKSQSAQDAKKDSDDGSEDSDDEGDPSNLVHESLLKGEKTKGQSRHGKAKFAPSEETPEQRDARTIFVGNVAIEVTKSRPIQKQLKRHILSFVPSAKIESVRFRSVAFKKPTAELPKDEDGKTKSKKPRAHDRDRAATWRADQGEDEEAEPKKTFLTPKEKKRIAFIKHEIHEGVDAVNAYVVFAHPPPAENRPANLPPPPPVMNPYEAAAECARLCDGSVFLDRTLRVDVVKSGTGPTASKSTMTGDPKATIFVGNLDFASKEEDLRAGSEDEAEAEERARTGAAKVQRPRTWVKRVRIIRDRDTQLGKGFAYVQFVDRECVDEILALEEGKLKFAKRKLRVQRCKTLPGGPKLKAAKPTRSAASSSKAGAPASQAGKHGQSPANSRAKAVNVPLVPARVPKGNPELGAKLATLPKEERKRVKAQDPDRVARRLAKKRAKALAEKGVKSKVDRERVRKPRGEKHAGKDKGKKDKPKKRVRSGKAIAKLNTKK
ncbi:hypothetical protein ONZ51_g267 [Trametes cubensis]|uniref:Nucleolar protein 12 n=1 Tax=Trametes cubensis TaxID=1111947 RepID=A0AAD7U3N9_9APHY|nr:hypothetical protein ONZ51_g267 [Trametes cubensis]